MDDPPKMHETAFMRPWATKLWYCWFAEKEGAGGEVVLLLSLRMTF
jgi:hypothetical protein